MTDKIKVIASGCGAYGDAGRIGMWYEFLITAEDGTLLKVRPAGGPSKRDRYWLYFGEDKVYKISIAEMSMFCDVKDILPPPEDLDTLVDLKDLIR
jgi:hypothetical protein